MLINSWLQQIEKKLLGCLTCSAATDVVRNSKMPLVCAPCLPVLLLLYSSFLFVCFVGLYAGHPYIQLISFEIFLLIERSCDVLCMLLSFLLMLAECFLACLCACYTGLHPFIHVSEHPYIHLTSWLITTDDENKTLM